MAKPTNAVNVPDQLRQGTTTSAYSACESVDAVAQLVHELGKSNLATMATLSFNAASGRAKAKWEEIVQSRTSLNTGRSYCAPQAKVVQTAMWTAVADVKSAFYSLDFTVSFFNEEDMMWETGYSSFPAKGSAKAVDDRFEMGSSESSSQYVREVKDEVPDDLGKISYFYAGKPCGFLFLKKAPTQLIEAINKTPSKFRAYSTWTQDVGLALQNCS